MSLILPSPTKNPYDRRYQQARAALLANRPPCHWCGAEATTADHEPPIEIVGYNHLQLVPACARCNYGRRQARKPPIPFVPPASREW